MLHARWSGLTAMVFVALVLGCGSIPNGPDESYEEFGDETRNEEWGFSITRPDSSWGVTMATYAFYADANGRPKVEVRMVRPSADEGAFEPTLYFLPWSVRDTTTITGLVLQVDSNLAGSFGGYVSPPNVDDRVTSDSTAHWQFSLVDESSANALPGMWFFVSIWLHGHKAYMLLGNGLSDDFPVDAYSRAASSLTFLD